MLDRDENDNIFGGYIFLCQPPYNSNFQFFEIKLLVLRTSNSRDSTVHALVLSISCMGAQWLRLQTEGPGFEPHWRHCVVVLEQDTFILA